MWRFLLWALAILMQSFASLPKSVPSRRYFAKAPSLNSGLSATEDDCDLFKEVQTTQSAFSLTVEL